MGQVIKFINSIGESITFSSEKPFLLQTIEGLSGVEATEITYKGMSQDGSSYHGSNLEDRQISVKFSLMCETYSELMQKRNLVNKVFNPKLGNGTLIYSYQGVERNIKCVPDGTPFMPLEGNKKDCTGDIVLLAHDPYWRDTTESKANIAYWKGSFRFPLTIKPQGITMGIKEPSLIVNVFNGGDVECGLKIEFRARGTIKNPSLFNVNTREYIKVNKTMVDGEIITIETSYGNKRIESDINGVKTNILNYFDLTSTFIQLGVGDNLFRYDADENLNNLEVSIYYTPRYLGV